MDIPQADFLRPAEFCRGRDLLRPGSLTGKRVDPTAIAFIYALHPYEGDEADMLVSPEDRRLILWPAAMGHEQVADREPVLRAMFGPDYREATKDAAYEHGYDTVELRRLAVQKNLFGRYGAPVSKEPAVGDRGFLTDRGSGRGRAGGVNGTAALWTGQQIGTGPVALAVFPAAQDGPAAAAPTLGAAVSDGEPVLIAAEMLGQFVERHAGAEVVCHDAAALHWLLHDHLDRRGEAAALRALWALSRECRLVDVMLLDQHLRRIRTVDGAYPAPLEEIAARLAGTELAGCGDLQKLVSAGARVVIFGPDPGPRATLAAVAGTVLGARRPAQQVRLRAPTVRC